MVGVLVDYRSQRGTAPILDFPRLLWMKGSLVCLGEWNHVSIRVPVARHQCCALGVDWAEVMGWKEFLRTSVSSKGWHVQWESVPPGEQSEPP